MGSHRTRKLSAALLLGLLAGTSLAAQEAGWRYSPLPGEGDRATLGCALGSTTTTFACIAVRCEDDFSTGIHIHTSRSEGDAVVWAITVDKQTRSFVALPSQPYGARLDGDTAWVLDNLRNGAVAYLEPTDGTPMPANHIALDGSLYAINHALAWCAPRVPANEPMTAPDVETRQ
jgi:hypothetical protein